MTVYVLVNPRAGSQKSDKIIQSIQKECTSVKIFQTRWKDDESEQLSRILSDFSTTSDQFAIIGGDGTLSKVLTQLPKDIPFAYFPAGSGNDFARSLNISVESSLQALTACKTTEISLLEYEGGIVVNSLDAGFAAQVIAYSESSNLKKYLNFFHLGKLTYLVFAIRTIFTRHSVDLEMMVDGKKYVLNDLFFFSLANGTYFGGGIMIWPDSGVHKTSFDIVYIQRQHFMKNILSLLDILLKRHKSSKMIRHISGEQASISFLQNQFIQVDGEMNQLLETHITSHLRQMYQ